MSRLTLAAVVTAFAAAVAAAPASAASGGGCALQGTATFTKGLGTTAQDFQYSFHGDLTPCQASDAAAPAAGKVTAGEVYTAPSGQRFQEPLSSGNGSCSSSTTSGTAIITWADNTVTVIDYETQGAAALVALTGSVVPSVTLPAINPAPDQPASTTITTTRYADNSALGTLAFGATPTDCAGGGVLSASIDGTTGLGTDS